MMVVVSPTAKKITFTGRNRFFAHHDLTKNSPGCDP